MKKTLSFILTIVMLFSLAGCSLFEKDEVVPETVLSQGEYIMTTNSGEISMFASNGAIVSTVSLGGTPESEYIYTMDEGHLYSPSLKDISSIPQVLYAVDKVTRKLTMLTVTNTSIIKKAEMILSDGNITQMYAYNGLFFYSVETEGLKAEPYSFERRQKLNKNGTLSYIQTVPLENTSKSTFIYMENYFNEYLETAGLSSYLNKTDAMIMNIPKLKHAIYEIPTDVLTWTANATNIYFFSNTQMGTYNLVSNKIIVYYGAINPVAVQYLDGINKETFLLSDFGDKSKTTMLMAVDYKDMNINKAIEIDYNNPIAMSVEKDNYIMMVFKVTNSKKTFSQLRILSYDDYSELYVIGDDYLPTKVLSSGEIVYLFNPYENYFLSGSIHSGALGQIPKNTSDGGVYSDLFLINNNYKSDYFYDEYGRMVDKNNHLINDDGELIDENNDKVNMYGQRIDALGRGINKEGELIDRFNNLIDIDGKIIKYVINSDGYYYNSNAEKVDIDGTVLVRNSDGEWVRPEDSDEAKVVITGHYDEYGNFIIDEEILNSYPNAYEMWQQQQADKLTEPEVPK